MCLVENESTSHLFGQCSYFRDLWRLLKLKLQHTDDWVGASFKECSINYLQCNVKYNYFPGIPYGRFGGLGISIFSKIKKLSTELVATRIMSVIVSTKSNAFIHKARIIIHLERSKGMPYGFFYGASQDGMRRVGMLLNLKREYQIHLKMAVGSGRNTKVELLAL